MDRTVKRLCYPINTEPGGASDPIAQSGLFSTKPRVEGFSGDAQSLCGPAFVSAGAFDRRASGLNAEFFWRGGWLGVGGHCGKRQVVVWSEESPGKHGRFLQQGGLPQRMLELAYISRPD